MAAEHLFRSYEGSVWFFEGQHILQVREHGIRLLRPGRRAYLVLQILGALAFFVLLFLVLAAFGFAFRDRTPIALLTAAFLLFLAALVVVALLRGALRILARNPTWRSGPLTVRRARLGTLIHDVRLGNGRAYRLKVLGGRRRVRAALEASGFLLPPGPT